MAKEMMLLLKITSMGREIKKTTFPNIKIELDMVAHKKENDFLLNKLNESQSISLLGNCL